MIRGQVRDRLVFGPARRRRRMHRLLRELDRLDASEAQAYGGARPRRTASRALGSALQVLVAVTVVGASVAGGTYLVHRQEPLGTPPEVSTGQGTFAFSQHQPGRPGVPVTYSPCEPITYVVNDAHAPPGAADLLEDAIDAVSDATGLVFEADGATDEFPFTDTDAGQLGRHGPVIIAWASPTEVPELAGDVAGLAGSSALTVGSQSRYVTGGVALDGPDLEAIQRRPGGDAQVRAIIKHELAHLVGLDHVDDPAELMHPENLGLAVFGPGDQEGLAALGSGRCP